MRLEVLYVLGMRCLCCLYDIWKEHELEVIYMLVTCD
jgi:hypothetical protein